MNPALQVPRSISGLLAVLLAAGCSPRSPIEMRRDAVETMGELVRTHRDSVPHAGPAWDGIEPEWRTAAIESESPEDFRRALVRLVDRLGDGHAAVAVAAAPAEAFPPCGGPIRLDGAMWICLHDPSCDPFQDTLARLFGTHEGRGRIEWFRLREIDGYAFRTPAAANALLAGEPGTTVEVAGTDAKGREVRRTLTRVTGMQSSVLIPESIAGLGDTYASAVLPVPPGTLSVAQGKRIGPDGCIGYLRVRRYEAGDRCRSWFCNLAIDRCDDRMRIAEIADAISGCDPIIIDLLGNGGGTCMHGSEILRHFLPPSLGRIPFAHDPAPPGGTLRRWPVDEASDRRERRIFLLIDGDTASAAEHVAAILKGAPGVTVIGAPTAGCEYSIVSAEIDGGVEFRFGGVPAVWDAGFRSAECDPVEPDVAIETDPRELVRDGPAVAAVRRHVAILRKAIELAETVEPAVRD